MPALKLDPEIMDKFQGKVEKSLIASKLDQEKEFLPEGQVIKLVAKDEVKSLLPDAPSSLIDHVCQRMRRVFLIIVLCRSELHNLHPLLESCQQAGMTDDHLPIENISRNGNGKCKKFNGESSRGCTHDKELSFFHNNWKSIDVRRFYEQQWTFFSPVFSREIQPELKPYCILPFTWVSETAEQGHFSEVREAIIHPDHCQGIWELTNVTCDTGNAIKGTRVAAKKLFHLAEPGYKVATAWEKEASALNQISKLRNRNLIRLVAAFKRGTEYYIMLEWADGGNLRKYWETHGTDGTDLDGNRIIDVLEQLVGLAGALSRLVSFLHLLDIMVRGLNLGLWGLA
jgi:hypothetical protein